MANPEAAGQTAVPAATGCRLDLRVADAIRFYPQEPDNSVIFLTPSKMARLSLMKGDNVFLEGICGKVTVCIVLADEGLDENEVGLNAAVRKNLRVELGDIISVHSWDHDVPYGTRVHLLPVEDTIAGYCEQCEGDLFEKFLQPYYKHQYRPAHQGDHFLCWGSSRPVEFKVISVEPGECCIVGPDTVIHWEGEPIKRRGLPKLLASGRMAKAMVLRGSRLCTVDGCWQGGLTKNGRGRVVRKTQSAHGKKSGWSLACQQARRALNIRGFAAIKKGTPFYIQAKEFLLFGCP